MPPENDLANARKCENPGVRNLWFFCIRPPKRVTPRRSIYKVSNVEYQAIEQREPECFLGQVHTFSRKGRAGEDMKG